MAARITTRTSTVKTQYSVFVDTGGWYSTAATDDRFHEPGSRYFQSLLDQRARLITSDYVIDETLTRLRYDISHQAATAFWKRIDAAQQASLLTMLRVNESVWAAALDIFARYNDQAFSFTDCTSFALVQHHKVDEVFTFDKHFAIFGLPVRPIV